MKAGRPATIMSVQDRPTSVRLSPRNEEPHNVQLDHYATGPARPRTAARVREVIDIGRTLQSDYNRMVLSPSPTEWDSFLILSDDQFSEVGFPWHPHRGFRTLTLVLGGLLEHGDNASGYGLVGVDDAQYMAAGCYVLQYELAHKCQPVHTLQLWLNLPPELKFMDTTYRDLQGSPATIVAAGRDDLRARSAR